MNKHMLHDHTVTHSHTHTQSHIHTIIDKSHMTHVVIPMSYRPPFPPPTLPPPTHPHTPTHTSPPYTQPYNPKPSPPPPLPPCPADPLASDAVCRRLPPVDCEWVGVTAARTLPRPAPARAPSRPTPRSPPGLCSCVSRGPASTSSSRRVEAMAPPPGLPPAAAPLRGLLAGAGPASSWALEPGPGSGRPSSETCSWVRSWLPVCVWGGEGRGL